MLIMEFFLRMMRFINLIIFSGFILSFTTATLAKTVKSKDLLGMSRLEVRPIVNRTPVKFDKRKIRKRLARRIAGNRNLIDWANCSYGIVNGKPVLEKFVPNKIDIQACLTLTFKSGDVTEQYFINDHLCDGIPSRFCLGGYSVETKIVTKLIPEPQGNDNVQRFQVNSVYRTKYHLNDVPQKKTNVVAQVIDSSINRGSKWDRVTRINTWHKWSPGVYSHRFEIQDRDYNILAKPKETAVYFPMTQEGASMSCTDQADAAGVATLLIGGVATAYLTNGVAVPAGAAVGGVAGAEGGPIGAGGGAIAGGGFAFLTASQTGALITTATAGFVRYQVRKHCKDATPPPPSDANPSTPPDTKPIEDGLTQMSCSSCRSAIEVRLPGQIIEGPGNEITINQDEVGLFCTDWETRTDLSDNDGDGICDD